MKTALVTGSAGFVGTHIGRRLASDGWNVVNCDVNDPDVRMRRDSRVLFATHGSPRYDLVVHLAAVVGGRLTISHDPMAVAVDLELDAAMFRWAVRTKQPRVVYFSSSAAYPTALQDKGMAGRKLRESDIDLALSIGAPDMTYGWAKLTGEMLAGYAEGYGVKVHVLRPFSGYGPGQVLDYPFPAYLERARRRDSPFAVWGSGTQQRDFVHIDDVVETMVRAVNEDHRGPLNVGTGRATSFLRLAEMCQEAVGYSAPIETDVSKPEGPWCRVADVENLHRLYVPRISLEEGIQQALNG